MKRLPPAPVAPRSEQLSRATTETFDLLIVGGGVTGAGAARDAVLRGLRVALLEADDFGAGTSSRSSRLVHGGMRYLEHGHFALVFESQSERRKLLQLAPHLVRPLQFVWPSYRGTRLPKWQLWIALAIYDTLALFRNVRSHRRLSAKQLHALEPALREDGLNGGATYFDAATDDARLAALNAIAAAEGGAVVLNHCAVEGLLHDAGQVCGVRARDRLAGRELMVKAKAVVNATGPWTDELRHLDQPASRAAVRGSKGVHIAVPRERLPMQSAVVLFAADSRVFFIIPSESSTVIGTTETETHVRPSEVRADEADVRYLLDSVNAYLREAPLTRDDVISAWAGIRPLVVAGYSGDGSANSASREHAIARSPTGLISISGGKLTTFRLMAKDVVNAAEKLLEIPHRAPVTDQIALPGGELESFDAEVALAAKELGDEALARHWVIFFGARWRRLRARVEKDRSLGERLVPELPYRKVEVVHAVEEELAVTLSDLLIRRTKIAFETRDHGVAAARAAWPLLAAARGDSGASGDAELESYEKDVHRLFDVDPASEAVAAAG